MLLTGFALGIVLGFVLQRGRFCVMGAFRDVWLSKSTRWLTALLAVIAVQAVLAQLMTSFGWIALKPDQLAVWAVTSGSPVFGLGIVLAGGCAMGTYYRSGEGLIGSWIALGLYAFTSAAMKHGIGEGVTDTPKDATQEATMIHETFHASPWVPTVVPALLVGWLIVCQTQNTQAPITALPPQKTGIAHVLFEKRWSPSTTALAMGVLAAIAYPLSAAMGRNARFGITTPSANVVSFLAAGDSSFADWGVWFVLGIISGSFIAAKGSGEFRLRAPGARTVVRAMRDGIFMGIGASIVGGCTIGNSLAQSVLFSWQGWLVFLFTFLGVGAGAKAFVQSHLRADAVAREVASVPTRQAASQSAHLRGDAES